MATDDDIIRKRLLIDGEGGGDDRRIGNLLKTFIKWCDTDCSDDDCYTIYQRMLGTLAQCEFSMEKTQMIYDMNIREMNNYESICNDIEKNVGEAHEKIAACKKELQQAKRIRKNRQEYDALAKEIDKQPDRQQTTKKLEELNSKLSQLQENREDLEKKLDMRRKQFHVLIKSIHELQKILDEDEKHESEIESMEISSNS